MSEIIRMKRRPEGRKILAFSSAESRESREETMFKQVALLQKAVWENMRSLSEIKRDLLEDFECENDILTKKLHIAVDENTENLGINAIALDVAKKVSYILQDTDGRMVKLLNLLKKWCSEYEIDLTAIESFYSHSSWEGNRVVPHLSTIEGRKSKFGTLERMIERIKIHLKNAEEHVSVVTAVVRPINGTVVYKDIYADLLVASREIVENLGFVNAFIKKLGEEK